jgi:hypothetical protein
MNNLSTLAEPLVELAEPGVERSKLRFLPPECQLEFTILSEGWKRSFKKYQEFRTKISESRYSKP